MKPSEVAKLIGITHAQVLAAVRKGAIPSRKKKLDNGNPNAFVYEISRKDALYYRDNRPKRGPKPRSKE
jgi:hypothetical protein